MSIATWLVSSEAAEHSILILTLLPLFSHPGAIKCLFTWAREGHLYWDGSCLSGTTANPETERSSSHDEEHLQSRPFLSNWVTALGPFSRCHPALVISLVCMLLVPWWLVFSHLLAYSVAFYSLLSIFCSHLHSSFTRTGNHTISPLVLPLWTCLIPSDLHALSSLTHTMLSTGHYSLQFIDEETDI